MPILLFRILNNIVSLRASANFEFICFYIIRRRFISICFKSPYVRTYYTYIRMNRNFIHNIFRILLCVERVIFSLSPHLRGCAVSKHGEKFTTAKQHALEPLIVISNGSILPFSFNFSIFARSSRAVCAPRKNRRTMKILKSNVVEVTARGEQDFAS